LRSSLTLLPVSPLASHPRIPFVSPAPSSTTSEGVGRRRGSRKEKKAPPDKRRAREVATFYSSKDSRRHKRYRFPGEIPGAAQVPSSVLAVITQRLKHEPGMADWRGGGTLRGRDVVMEMDAGKVEPKQAVPMPVGAGNGANDQAAWEQAFPMKQAVPITAAERNNGPPFTKTLEARSGASSQGEQRIAERNNGTAAAKTVSSGSRAIQAASITD
ncbi:MAG: hypothetical protein BJ554DRAFT_5362, partial [Olpidium bornovanus]